MISLHVLDATGRLVNCRNLLKQGFLQARSKVRKTLPINDIDIVMQVLPKMTIAETGIGGYSPSADVAFIFLNPDLPQFAACLETELVPMIAHELFHCMRWKSQGYGKTLGEALVSEGLALHFETKFRAQAPFYATALNNSQLSRLLNKAVPALEETNYDHVAWFVGSAKHDIPKYGGYSLAYMIVATALVNCRRLAQHSWDRRATDFLKHV